MVNAKEELKAVEQGLFDELTKQNTRLGHELDVLKARKTALTGIATHASKKLDGLAEKAVPYQQLQDEENTAKSNYDVEYNRVMEAARTQAAAAVPVLVRLLDGPSLPDAQDPRRPIVWLNILIAVVSGLVLALVYAFLGDHFDHSLKSIDDAEQALGVPVLASVPKLGRNIIRTR